MADLSLADIGSHIGQSTGNMAVDISNAVADGVCSIYKNSPASLAADPLGVGAVQRAFFDTLCNGRTPGLPAPPSRPFNGGQCSGVLYRIDLAGTFYWQSGASAHVPNSGTGVFTFYLYGPLVGIVGMADTPGYAFFFRGADSHGNQANQILSHNPGGFGDLSQTDHYSLTTLNISRNDGNPDTCGDLPGNWPVPGPSQSFPIPLPPVNVPSPNGGSYNFSPTIVVADKLFGVNVNMNNNFNIKFDFGGVTFNFGKGKGNSGDNSGDFSDINNQLQQIQNNLNNLSNNFGGFKQFPPPGKPPSPASHNYDPKPPSSGDKSTGIDSLEYVQVDLSTLPSRDKVIFGNENSPAVYFAGWIEFLQGNLAYSPRIPIQFEHNVFRVPDGANGYAYLFTNGAAGTVTEITKKAGT